MTSTTRSQNNYDHRLRELIRSTGDIDHAIQLGVPRSTARGWMTSEEYPLKRLQAFNDEIAIEIRKRIEGGTITFDEKAPSKPAVRVVFRDSDMTDAGLDHLNRDLSTAGQARDRL